MNYYCNILISIFMLSVCHLFAAGFTISSYNCGGLSSYYDYLRAVNMEKLMQERHMAEPEYMSLNEKIQKLALKRLFSQDENEKNLAEDEWNQKEYQKWFKYLATTPTDKNSLNKHWNEKAESMITSYTERPVVISDEKVNQLLTEHFCDLSRDSDLDKEKQLQETHQVMAKRIISYHLNYDIICLQEANYLNADMFPKRYTVLFSESGYSKNGIAWNQERFDLVKPIGDILGRAFAIQLKDKKTDKIILIVSGHITGCNPYQIEKDPKTGQSDSAKGDCELLTIVNLNNNQEADLVIIGMDSNVTSLHPRLNILKNAGYQIDYENYLEPTCTNPYQVLNTRIDWIALKSHLKNASIINIPVLSVGLNSMQTNMSDHKPIAAKINY